MGLIPDLTHAPIAAGYFLVSPWQPIIMLLPLIAWAWMVSAVFDKHAQRFFLGREGWNIIHLSAGTIALVALLFMPIEGWAGFAAGLGAMIIILGADIAAFVSITNKDERVPEHARLTLDFSSWAEARAAKKDAKQQGTSSLNIRGPKGPVSVPPKDSSEYSIRVAAEQLIISGATNRASQVDIVPVNQQTYAVSWLVDGVRQAGDKLPVADAVSIIDYWKKAANLDTDDRRRKQTGDVQIRTDAETYEVRLTTSGSQGGVRLSFLFDPAKAVNRTFSNLGLLDNQQALVKKWTTEEVGGTVLIASPSDGGRTTTLYTMMKQHDAYTANVQSLELQTEDTLEGIRQITFDPSDEAAEFSVQLRSMLRRDPDVVGVAELPDVDTAKEVARADLARCRVYLSMKGDSSMIALQTYAKAVGDGKATAKSLQGIMGQALVRKLCENCKVPYQPPAELLKKVGLPADKVKQLHKKGGQVMRGNKPEVCPVCSGVGYVGQVGVFEVFPISKEAKAAITEGNWNGVKQELRKSQLPTIQQAALRKVVEGHTSLEEVNRVVSSSQKKTAPKKKPANA